MNFFLKKYFIYELNHPYVFTSVLIKLVVVSKRSKVSEVASLIVKNDIDSSQ